MRRWRWGTRIDGGSSSFCEAHSEMEFVLQEFNFVQGFQANSFPLLKFLPGPGSFDKDVVPVSGGEEDLRRHDVESRVLPRYIGGVNLEERAPA